MKAAASLTLKRLNPKLVNMIEIDNGNGILFIRFQLYGVERKNANKPTMTYTHPIVISLSLLTKTSHARSTSAPANTRTSSKSIQKVSSILNVIVRYRRRASPTRSIP